MKGGLEQRLSGPAALGASIALISATQLRVPGLPLGAGEVLLASWCGLNLLRSIGRGEVNETQPLWLLYWLTCFSALALGALAALVLNVFNLAGLRDGIAHALAAALCFACVRRSDARDLVLRSARWYAVFAALGYACCLLLALAGRGAVGPVDMWYGLRFRGPAENPNQLALAMLPIPFIAIEALEGDPSSWKRTALLCTFGAGIVVGMASLSNALLLAWSVGSVLLVPGVIAWLRRVSLRDTWGLVRQFALPLAILATFGGAAFRYRAVIHAAGQAAYDAGGEGDDRMARWRHGFSAIEQSPVVGLGPGSFSGPNAAFEGEEAHNTAIDWTMSTGVIGLLALGTLLVTASWRNRYSVLRLSFLVAILAFTAFHFALRQPIFWLLMLVLIVAPPPPVDRPSTLARSS